MRHRSRHALLVLLLALLVAAAPQAQQKITTPKESLGFDAGDDYCLANYTQLLAYFKTLDQQSDRMKLVEIGTTAEGRPMVMAIITSPANHAKLDRYKEISRRLSLAEGLTDDEARKLAQEGRAVVWIDGGLHGTEVVPAQGLFQMAYDMTSRTDAETMRILDDVILLLTPANPDGMELVSNWYMREKDAKKRTMSGLPRLYQKYVGHDNNRDSYMSNQPETEAFNRQMFIEWFPQIMYNQHQTGPAGTVLFAPPFRDPFNYNYDPLVPMGIELVGAAIHNRFILEGKAGAVSRNEASYSTWFNGGVRTTTGFHNQIGLLTEIIGNPTPMQIPFMPNRLLPDTSKPMPIEPQEWHQKQSVEYLMTCNRAILDIASRLREDFLFRIYRMGKNSIDRGSKDHWTLTPKRVAAVQEAAAQDRPAAGGGAGAQMAGGGGRGGGANIKYFEMLRKKEDRDPRGYILPSDQPDFLTATKFASALIKNGVAVHRATAAFDVAGKKYPAGSYVVKAAQAFRPHVRDMFEPQDHPDDIPYPGGPPRPPYDATGWTLAYQMGVQFDRILDAFDGPFEKLPMQPIKAAPAAIAPAKAVAGYLLSHAVNDGFVATNRLLAAKEEVYWLKAPFTAGGKTWPAGTIYVPAKPATKPAVEKLAKELGLGFEAAPVKPTGEALKLKPLRVGLWDRYGGSMDSGWIRWMLEQAFPTTSEVVYAPALDAGNLNAKYDVIVFPSGAIPGEGGRGRGGFEAAAPSNIPDEYKPMLGNVTAEKTVPQLKQFLEAGGTIVTIGSSSSLARQIGLPVYDHLVERQAGVERRLGPEKYYVPGSVLRVAVDNTSPLAWGLSNQVDVFFDNSPVFKLGPDAALKGVRPVAWFDSPAPLRSGWAWGQSYLQGGVAIAEATVGKGRLFLLGPEVTFRAQPHGTFKFLFNGLYYGSAVPVVLK
ncbi:MAG: peptidase [Acidobacteria bacterium]|nr:MAG: peptidase [Acidobacteriota bacterium]